MPETDALDAQTQFDLSFDRIALWAGGISSCYTSRTSRQTKNIHIAYGAFVMLEKTEKDYSGFACEIVNKALEFRSVVKRMQILLQNKHAFRREICGACSFATHLSDNRLPRFTANWGVRNGISIRIRKVKFMDHKAMVRNTHDKVAHYLL